MMLLVLGFPSPQPEQTRPMRMEACAGKTNHPAPGTHQQPIEEGLRSGSCVNTNAVAVSSASPSFGGDPHVVTFPGRIASLIIMHMRHFTTFV